MEEERKPALLISGILLGTCKAENAWQGPAAFYKTAGVDHLALHVFQGNTALSLNNRSDLEGGLQTLTHIAAGFLRNFGAVPHIAVGVKHGSPCSAAVSYISTLDAVKKMIACRPEAIFGGTVIANFAIDGEDADALSYHKQKRGRRILDVVAAAHITPCARKILERADDRCRFLENREIEGGGAIRLDTAPLIKYARGEIQVQSNYTFVFDRRHPSVETYGRIDEEEWKDIVLAWAIGSTSPSNTITLVRGGMVVANSGGQHDRRVAVKAAILIADDVGHATKGAVAYSDSFFPFDDGPRLLVKAGIATTFTTTGSVRDKEVLGFIRENGTKLVTIPDAKGRGFFGS